MPGVLPGPNDPGAGGGVLGVNRQPLSGAQVAAVAYLAGFRAQALRTAVAVSFAEDGSHDPRAQNHNSNGTTDTGLWQINSVHSQYPAASMMIPLQNAHAAYTLSAGGHDWSPWSTYNSGAYVAQQASAQRAISQMNSQGGAQRVASTIGGGEAGQQFGIVSGAEDVLGAVESVPHFLGMLADVGLWERVGFVVAGLALGGIGLYAIIRALGISPPVPIPV